MFQAALRIEQPGRGRTHNAEMGEGSPDRDTRERGPYVFYINTAVVICANQLRQILNSRTFQPILPVALIIFLYFVEGALTICHKTVIVLWFCCK